ncbi:hypothetical protein [Aeromicrobium sp. 179-A 4D2 NHS]
MKKNTKKSKPAKTVTTMTHTAGDTTNPRSYDPVVRAGSSFKSVR